MTSTNVWHRGRLVFVLLAALGAPACSLSEDWMWAHPGDWFGESRADRPVKALPSATRPPPPGAAERAPPADTTRPNLASVPPRPEPSTTAAERRSVESSLSADRDNARYTDEQLRGRTSTSVAAAPPAPRIPPPPAASSEVPAAAPRTPVERGEVPPPAAAAPARVTTPARTAAAPSPSQPQPSAVSRPIPSIVQQPAAPSPSPLTSPPVPTMPTRGVAAAAPAPASVPGAQYAVTAPLPNRPMSLDEVFRQQLQASARPSLAGAPQYMAPQTQPVAAPPQPPNARPAGAAAVLSDGSTALAGGGPFAQPTIVAMGGGTAPSTAPALSPGSAAAPSRLAMATFPGSRLATVRFDEGSARLSRDDSQALQQAAEMAKARNARLRVVGFASADSARGGATERLKLANFNISMDRAEAVARELVRLGVNPASIAVEAKPEAAAGAGGTKAEIYLEN